MKISKSDDWGKIVYYDKYLSVEELLKDDSMFFDGVFDSKTEEEWNLFEQECLTLTFEQVISKINKISDFYQFNIDD